MSESTPRHALDLLVPGQAQKDVTHNEAVLSIDLLLHPEFESASVSAPPDGAAPGRMWIVPEAATGAWEGRAGQIAAQTAAGWRFLRPAPGTVGWLKTEQRRVRWDGASWRAETPVAREPVAVSAASGGAVIDAEARAAIVELQVLLRSLGFVT